MGCLRPLVTRKIIVPEYTGAPALIIRDTGDTKDVLKVEEDGDIVNEGTVVAKLNAGVLEISAGKLTGDLKNSGTCLIQLRRDAGDYGGGFTNYTPPAGEEGYILVAEDTNATTPGRRLYVFTGGVWRYVDLT